MTKHFVFLDELRGIAALSVALLHASQIFQFGLSSHAHLAVDFFFCLSGFVLANAYDEKLRSGAMRAGPFVLKRLIRLYPMILAGVALGVLAALVTTVPYGNSFASISILAAGALLLLPLGLFLGQEAFAINNPLWSLCFELIANGVYAVAARGRKILAGQILLLVLFAIALLIVIEIEGTIEPVGFATWRAFFGGLARVAYPFFAGILIFRWNLNHHVRKIPYQLPLLALIGVLFFPLFMHSGMYEFVCIVLFIPMIVALAAKAALPTEARTLALHMGRLSYPFYVLHAPVLRLGAQFQSLTQGVVPLPLTVGATLVAAGWLAHLMSTGFDGPVRAYLQRAVAGPGRPS